MKALEYEERLTALNLWSLEESRYRADTLEVYTILKELSSLSMRGMFSVCGNATTRGHLLKLAENRCQLDLRKFFFSERVIGRWSKLDQTSIDSQTINQFKNRLQRVRNTQTGFFEE